MKTVILKNIDDYNIIVGFDNPTIDPVETEKNVENLIPGLSITKKLKEKIQEIKKIHKLKMDAINKMKFAEIQKDADLYQQAEKEINKRDNDFNKLNNRLIELKQKQIEKIKDLRKENKIYFEPAKNEIRISNEDYEILSTKFIEHRQNGNLTDKDGNEIEDNRNIEVIKNGVIRTIKKIGEPIDGELISNLTPEKIKKRIYKHMSLEDIEAEKQNRIQALTDEAAHYRSGLEIQGDPDALTKAQTFYNDQLAIINTEYDEILAQRNADPEGESLNAT